MASSKRPARITDENAAARKRKRGQPRARTAPPPVYLEPWERMPGESQQRYEAFITYRDQIHGGGQLRRSIERAAHAVKKSPVTLNDWSREDHWRERVAGWDRHMQSIKDNATLRAVEATAERQAMQIQAAAQTLTVPLQKLLTKIQADPEYLDALSPWQLTRLSLAAARGMPQVIVTERLVQGLSTSNVDAHIKVTDERAAAEAMTTVDRERYLLGEGVDDGRGQERLDAARRAQDRSGR